MHSRCHALWAVPGASVPNGQKRLWIRLSAVLRRIVPVFPGGAASAGGGRTGVLPGLSAGGQSGHGGAHLLVPSPDGTAPHGGSDRDCPVHVVLLSGCLSVYPLRCGRIYRHDLSAVGSLRPVATVCRTRKSEKGVASVDACFQRLSAKPYDHNAADGSYHVGVGDGVVAQNPDPPTFIGMVQSRRRCDIAEPVVSNPIFDHTNDGSVSTGKCTDAGKRSGIEKPDCTGLFCWTGTCVGRGCISTSAGGQHR